MQAHKSEDVIDHPANSVVDDKILIKRYNLTPALNSVDGWQTSGSVVAGVSNISLYTTNTVNSAVNAYVSIDDILNFIPNVLGNPALQVIVGANIRGTGKLWIGIGDIQSDYGIGFYITETTIYARHTNNAGDYIDHSLGSFSDFTSYKLRVEVFSGIRYDYYIDDEFVYSFNCVSGDDSLSAAYPIFLMAQTTQASHAVDFGVYFMNYSQDL